MTTRFAATTRIGRSYTTVEVLARTEACAETAALFICALASAAGVLDEPEVRTSGHDEAGRWRITLRGYEPEPLGAATRRAMASILLDARVLTRQALASRGVATWSSVRAFNRGGSAASGDTNSCYGNGSAD